MLMKRNAPIPSLFEDPFFGFSKECKRAAKRYGDTSTKIKFSSTDVREGVSALLKKEGMSAELITSYGSKYELIVDWSRRLK